MTLPRLTSQWPTAWLDAYQERAAIKEYDAKMDRNQAEAEAEREMRALAARK
jgi:hypothetical protein